MTVAAVCRAAGRSDTSSADVSRTAGHLSTGAAAQLRRELTTGALFDLHFSHFRPLQTPRHDPATNRSPGAAAAALNRSPDDRSSPPPRLPPLLA